MIEPNGGELRILADVDLGGGQLDHIEGRHAAAQDRYEESLSLRRELGNRPAAVHCLVLLGDLARLEGDHGQAMRSFCEALDTQRGAGDPTYCAMALERLAAILPPGEESAELIGCAQGLRASTSQPFDLIEHHLPVADAVAGLGAEGE